MKQNRLLSHLILLRIFATFTVVIGHSIIVYSDSWNYYSIKSQSFFIASLKKMIDIYQMPLFFFISGYLFYYLLTEVGRYNKKNGFLINKIKRLLLPYFIVSFFYMIPLRILGNYKPYVQKNILSIYKVDILLGKDAGNLWFLPVLFFIFMIVYFFKMQINLFLSSVCVILLAELSIITPNTFFFKKTLFYLLFFYFGFLIRHYRIEVKSKLIIKPYLCIYVFIYSMICYLIFNRHMRIPSLFDFNLKLILGLLSCFLLYIGAIVIIENFPSIHKNRIIRIIDKNSFGIYLFHSPLLYPVLRFTAEKSINPYLYSLVTFLILFFSSLTLTILLSKSKILKL